MAPNDWHGPPCVRITADTEEHARKCWDRFTWHLTNTDLSALLESWNKERNLVTLKTGATAQIISADNPNALSGDPVTAWFVDEAQYLSYAAWQNLYPSTSDRKGVIVMFGVSEGEGPFREVCLKGDAKDINGARTYPEFMRLSYPTAANPLIDRDEIETAARILPANKFEQLYLARWVGEAGKIFRNVEGCTNRKEIHQHDEEWGYTDLWTPNHTYYGGLDLARFSDYTVYSIFTRTGELVAWDRFHETSWEIQKAQIARLSRAFHHPQTAVDATGLAGDPLVDDLSRLGMRVEGITIGTNRVKRQLCDDLAVRIGSGAASYPDLSTLKQELLNFEAKKSKNENSNIITYSAPAGMTDDFVMSLALANSLLPKFNTRPQELDWDMELVRQQGEWEAIK